MPNPVDSLKRFDVRRLKSACSTCTLHELCLPAGLERLELEQVDKIVNQRRPVTRGTYLYRAGAPLRSIYAIRDGFMKSCVLHEDGREQVAGFHMAGDLIGLDAISTGKHVSDAVALEDCEVCEIPFAGLEQLSRNIPSLQRHFHRLMSREIVHDYGVMLLLGSMRAEERLAAFLLNLSRRMAARGHPPCEFNLPMTRQEMGSYLGLKLETVSRTLSSFQKRDLIEISRRHLKISDMRGLRAATGQPSCG